MIVFSRVCAIQAYLLNELSDHWCDKEISFSECLIASIMLDCLSRCRVIAPMAPRITQMTSCQRDLLYRVGFHNAACSFSLTDGVMGGKVEQFSTVPVATGYQRPQLMPLPNFQSMVTKNLKNIPFLQDLDMIHSSVSTRCVLA